MAETLYRTEILLEPAQHQALTEMARREGRSISDIARQMIGEKLAERQPIQTPNGDEYLALLDRLSREWRQAYAERDGREPDFDMVAEMNHMREERDAEILFGRRD